VQPTKASDTRKQQPANRQCLTNTVISGVPLQIRLKQSPGLFERLEL
jgi:hypothetical protein